MTKLILVRHGLSEANVNNIFAGHYDADLTPQGHIQAEKTAEYIAANYKVDAVYSSDLRRAYKTAEHIADKFGITIQKSEKLREIYAGEWEGRAYDYITENYRKAYAMWKTDIGNARCTGGESTAELGKRVTCELEKIISENAGKTIVAATHATPIRAAECIWKGISMQQMKDIPWVSNASVTVVDCSGGKFVFEKIGEDSFLANLKTCLSKNV